MKLDNLMLRDVHASVEAGSYSYEQLMRDTLAVIKDKNDSINAVVALQEESDLIEQASKADQIPVSGALHGIPIALKDLVNTAGIVSTSGSPLLKDHIPIQDDVAAQRIKDAGAIVIGKTNTPEFGLGSQSYNTVYGTTANPYDLSKTSGGSSGGAAAALASGMLIVADGSDMMGSLRNPAAFCNVYGFRPTYGLVPNEPRGDVFLQQLSTLGPMARTVDDLAILLDVMAGPDSRHPHSINGQSNFAAMLPQSIESSQRIAWLADWDGELPMEAGVLALCEDALELFKQAGHSVELLAAPFNKEQLWHSWSVLRSFTIASLLSDAYANKQTRELLKPEAIYEIESGMSLSCDDIAKASQIRSDWFMKTAELFSTFDCLVLPSSQVFPFDKTLHWPKQINNVSMSSYHRWMEVVVPASLIGLPALNVPVGFSDEGLPMGMQLIGARHSDLPLLQLSNQYHQCTQWPQKHRPPHAQ